MVSYVSGFVALDLRSPVAFPAAGRMCYTAIMPMPKAALNMDTRLIAGQNDIWSSREARNVKPIAKAISVQNFSDHEFWFSIFRPDLTHHERALLFREYVHSEANDGIAQESTSHLSDCNLCRGRNFDFFANRAI